MNKKISPLDKLLRNITPPVVFSGARRIKRALIGKSEQFSVSEIHTITGGPLAGEKIFLDKTGWWQKEMIEGAYDSFFFDYIKKLDISGKTILDIGAHIGYHSLAFAKLVGKNGKVYAFEPNTFNLERLKKNCELNPELSPRISPFAYAISDKRGKEEFVFSPRIEKGSSSGSFLDRSHTIEEKSVYEEKSGFTRTTVETITIDEFIEKEKIKPSIIKIDIEGAEYLALGGAMKTLTTLKPTIFVEIHSIFNMLKVSEIFNKVSYKTELLEETKDGRCFLVAEPK